MNSPRAESAPPELRYFEDGHPDNTRGVDDSLRGMIKWCNREVAGLAVPSGPCYARSTETQDFARKDGVERATVFGSHLGPIDCEAALAGDVSHMVTSTLLADVREVGPSGDEVTVRITLAHLETPQVIGQGLLGVMIEGGMIRVGADPRVSEEYESGTANWNRRVRVRTLEDLDGHLETMKAMLGGQALSHMFALESASGARATTAV